MLAQLKAVTRIHSALLILVLFMFCAPSYAARVIQLDVNDTFDINLRSHLDIVQLQTEPGSKIGSLGLEQFTHTFKPLWNNEAVVKVNHNSILLRFALSNPSELPIELWLAVKANHNYHSQLAQLTGERLNPIKTSVLLEQQTLASSLSKHKQIHQLQVSPGKQNTYYLLIQAPSGSHIQFRLQNPQLSLQELVNYGHGANMALGALLILALVNFVAARITADKWLAFHAWYLLFLGLIQALFYGHFDYVLGLPLSWQTTMLSLLFLGANISLSYFCWSMYRQISIDLPWRLLCQVSFLAAFASFVASQIWQLDHGLQDVCLLLTVLLFCTLSWTLSRQNNDSFALALAMARFFALISFSLIWLALSLDLGAKYQQLLTLSVLLLEALSISIILYYRRIHYLRKQWSRNQERLLQETQIKTQKDVLSRFSHDIRTPISGVTGMAELLADTPLSGTQSDYVETIQSSAKLLLSMINGVLDNSLLDYSLNVKLAPFELGALVDDTLKNYQSRAENEDIELITDINSELPEIVIGDATRIRQILAHLLNYAFSHTAQGEVLVRVKADNQYNQEHILFSVEDTGEGLNQEQQRALFESNHDLETQDMQSASFAIVKRLIQEMQGQIGVKSQPKQGCEIWFSLPLASQSIQRTDTDIDEALRQKRLLIVDDNATIRKLVYQQGNSWGMQVFEAASGSEALALIRSKQNIKEFFDVVVVDHKMPGMSGLQLAGKIAEDAKIQPKPLLLMLTGLSKTAFSDTASAYGIRRILTKPVSSRLLKNTLAEEILKQKSSPLPQLALDKQESLRKILSEQSLDVLIAEDNPVSQQVIQAMLKKLGAKATLATDGQQALDAVCEQSFDLVLMDCEMPVLDGLEASRAIRSWEQYHQKPPTPIIALTGHILAPQVQACLDAGMNAHLSKPLELAKLENSLLEALANKLNHAKAQQNEPDQSLP